MDSRMRLTIGALMAAAAGFIVSPPGHAEPLTPLKPGENQFLDALHKVFAAQHDPAAFRSDGELLTRGYFVCERAGTGQTGQAVTFQPPALTQLALIYLCP